MITLPKKMLTVIAAVSLSLSFVVPSSSAASSAKGLEEYLISFESPSDALLISNRIAESGGEVLESHWGIKALAVRAQSSLVAELSDSFKITVSENESYRIANNTFPAANWGLDRIDQPNLPLNNSFITSNLGAGVNIYMADSGINLTHKEFTGRIRTGVSFIEDGRGVSDCNGHGSHLSGIAMGSLYGVAKKASITPVRIFGCTNETDSFILASAMNWIIADHKAGEPAVVNLSLAGSVNPFVDKLMSDLTLDGLVVVVAAGNSSADACSVSPARSPDVIAVAASENNDSSAFYTNFGSCVDLYAPGGGDGMTTPSILSAWFTSTTSLQYSSGTSQATPHVAGVAAIYLSMNPTATPLEVRNAILNSAVPRITNAPTGTTNKLLQLTSSTGAPVVVVAPPIVVAPPFVVAPPVIVEPPVDLDVFSGSLTSKKLSQNKIRVTWDLQTPGGRTSKAFAIAMFDENIAAPISVQTVPGNSLPSYDFQRKGNSYRVYFEVYSFDSQNNENPVFRSNVISFPTPPGVVSKVSFDYGSNGAVRVSWAKPAKEGTSAIARYQVRVSKTSSGKTWNRWVSVSSKSPSYLLPKQTVGLERHLEIRTVTKDGSSITKAVFKTR